MLTEGIKRLRAEGTSRVLKDRREGREKEVLLEKDGDGGVVEPRGLVGSRKTGEGDGRMRLGDGRGMVNEQTVSSRRCKQVVMGDGLEGVAHVTGQERRWTERINWGRERWQGEAAEGKMQAA